MEIEPRPPSVGEYLGLRRAVGWNLPTAEQAARAIDASAHHVVAVDGGDVIGMARAVGDGLYWFIGDVIVVPAHQGAGIGRALMEALVARLDGSMANLVAAPDVAPFYERLGFVRPDDA